MVSVPFFCPNRERFHNFEELVLAGCSIVVLIFGLVFYASTGISETQTRVLVAFMIVSIGFMGVVVAFSMYHSGKLAVASDARAKREAKEAIMREAGEVNMEMEAQRAIALSVYQQEPSSTDGAGGSGYADGDEVLSPNPAVAAAASAVTHGQPAAWDIGANMATEDDIAAPITNWKKHAASDEVNTDDWPGWGGPRD